MMPGPKPIAVHILLLLTVVIHAIFLSTSTQAQVSHATSRTLLRRRQSKTAAKPGSNYTPMRIWEQNEYVKAHNDLRGQAKVPPLQWHPGLAKSSHMWAMQLLGKCDYRSHSKGNNYGENIFWSLYKEFTATDVVKKWHSEIVHFDHVTNLCRCQPETDKCECGHYLNVVWKTTQWVGCSSALYCSEAKGLIVVCQYDPIGNYKGMNPFNPSTHPKNTPTHVPVPVPALGGGHPVPVPVPAPGGGHHVPAPGGGHHVPPPGGGHHIPPPNRGRGGGGGHQVPPPTNRGRGRGGHHQPPQRSNSMNIGPRRAQHSTPITFGVSHAQYSTSINMSVSHDHNSNSDNSDIADHASQTTFINDGSYDAHVSLPHQPLINSDIGHAQDPTSINSGSSVSQVPPPSLINTNIGHAQHPASINYDSTTANVQQPPLPPVNNGIGNAQDPNPTAINSGGGHAEPSTSINSGSPATDVPPMPPTQSMTTSSNPPSSPASPSFTV